MTRTVQNNLAPLRCFPGRKEQRVSEGGLVVVAARLVHVQRASDEEPICQLAIRCPARKDWHPPVPQGWPQFVSSLRRRPGALQ